MTEKKKSGDGEDGVEEEEGEDRFDNLVPVTGGLIHTEVLEDDESTALRFRIQEIERRVDEGKLELGALFFRVRANALFTRWQSPLTGKPYQTWEEYVDTESSFSTRSANHMLAMWWWFSELEAFPQVREMIRQVGWTKARVLVGLVDDDNWQKWFELASRVNRKRLETHARAAMDKAGVPRRPSLGLGRPNPRGVLPAPIDAEGEALPESGIGKTDWVEADLQAPTKTKAKSTGVVPAEEVVTPMNEAMETNPIAITGSTGERAGLDVPSDDDLKGYEQKRVPWTALMDEAQRKHVEAAIVAAYDVLKDVGKHAERSPSDQTARGTGLEMMATHFLAFFSGANAVNKDLRSRIFFKDIMKGLETSFGIDVIAIDRKKGTIIHGVPDEAFEAIEKKFGVDLVAIKKGTNEVVYGWETASRVDEAAAEETEDSEGGEES